MTKLLLTGNQLAQCYLQKSVQQTILKKLIVIVKQQMADNSWEQHFCFILFTLATFFTEILKIVSSCCGVCRQPIFTKKIFFEIIIQSCYLSRQQLLPTIDDMAASLLGRTRTRLSITLRQLASFNNVCYYFNIIFQIKRLDYKLCYCFIG